MPTALDHDVYAHATDHLAIVFCVPQFMDLILKNGGHYITHLKNALNHPGNPSKFTHTICMKVDPPKMDGI